VSPVRPAVSESGFPTHPTPGSRRERPRSRWCHASTDLDDFALITWAVDPDRVAALLPPNFAPDVRDGRALISMVAFRDVGFHFRVAPFARVSCGQVNYRTYVTRAGADGPESGVWFFGTTLDSVFVQMPRRTWRMPWHRGRMRIVSRWASGGCASWRTTITGSWGSAVVALRGTGRPLPVPNGFRDTDDASAVILDPFVGWYGRSDGSGVGRYSVWHERLELEEAVVDHVKCQVFTDLGLIESGATPRFAGVQRRVSFEVHTPPTREVPDLGNPPAPGAVRPGPAR